MKKIMWLLFLLIISAIFNGEVTAQEKMIVGYSAIGGSQIPAWIGKDAGIFAKYGLDVELYYFGGGTKAVQALVAGDVKICEVSGSAVVNSALAGSGLVILAGNVNVMLDSLLSSKEITKAEQLKGKKVGISSFGGASDFAMRYALKRVGLDPDKDVTILQIGDEPVRFQALKAGSIQGTVVEAPLTVEAKKLGFNLIADLAAMGVKFQHTGIVAHPKFLKEQPETAKKFMRAYVDTIHYFKTRKNESTQIIAKYMKLDKIDDAVAVYDIFSDLIEKKPYPSSEGIQALLDMAALKNPKAKTAKPAEFIDTSWLAELDKSGFIDGLYK